MKFTLKILKAALNTANEYGNVMKWIEGFEKELREHECAKAFMTCHGKKLIEEILGDADRGKSSENEETIELDEQKETSDSISGTSSYHL